jgi:hypothetical protein
MRSIFYLPVLSFASPVAIVVNPMMDEKWVNIKPCGNITSNPRSATLYSAVCLD